MVLDGNSILNRAFYGIRLLSTTDGLYTNAVYGFIMILQKLLADDSPDALCATFDLKGPTFRHDLYDGYKAKRKGMPDELAVQLPYIKQVLAAMNIRIYEKEGYEADDLIGAIASSCASSGWECVVVTGDRDSLQLIGENVRVKLVTTRGGKTETTEYDEAGFSTEYGFAPINLIDLKALMGDSSDNIPGVAGIGEKTAMDLIRRFGTLERVYQNLDSPEIRPQVRKKLEEGRESALMSYKLAKIDQKAPLSFEPGQNMLSPPDNDALYTLFFRLEFNKLIERFSLSPPEDKVPEDSSFEVEWIGSADMADILSFCQRAPFVSFVVTENLNAIALTDGSRGYLIEACSPGQDGRDEFSEFLNVFFSPKVKKISHNIKSLMTSLLSRGIDYGGFIFDTALAAYLLNPNETGYTLTKAAAYFLSVNLPEALYDKDPSGFFGLDIEAKEALKSHAHAVLGMYKNAEPALKEQGMDRLFGDIELPLCSVLAHMEHAGFFIDRDQLTAFGKMLGESISVLQRDIFSCAGTEFNINSTKQLGEILFEKLMLPSYSKTKTGYSTNIDVLEKLRDKHPIINLLIEYRKLTKLKNTYADGLSKVISSDGRIHTSFHMTATATGRLSSTEPNLQNIPIRTELGGELRKMFVAGDGKVLVDADYSQIELRILAHISGDSAMKTAFEIGEDIHLVTASQVFGVPLNEVTPLQRSRAKAVNFGIVYGISDFSLAQDINVSRAEAKRYIESYLEKYSGVRQYMHDIVEQAKRDGYVTTIFGRRRYLPELKSSNYSIRSFGERVALNMPIQGSAADIIKLAMVNVSKRFKEEGLSACLLLQVHDELIAEAPISEAEAACAILTGEMENAITLSVPLIAKAHFGKSWYDAK